MNQFNLADFVRESNRIEGIHREPTEEEIAETKFLSEAPEPLLLPDLERFVGVHQPGAIPRFRTGLNVQVGSYYPPAGGPEIRRRLTDLLTDARSMGPYLAHVRYEQLHPFTDGNGRSGRAVWLWAMGGIDHAPLGFLHTFYYQTLKASG